MSSTRTEEQKARSREATARYRRKNPDTVRAARAKYWEENREQLQANARARWADNPEHRAKKSAYHKDRRPLPENRKAKLIVEARTRAKAAGMEHSITVEDIHWPDVCPVLGIELNYTGGTPGTKDSSPSLDRWNNNVGYTVKNTVVISWRANKLKSNGTLEELFRVAYYAKYGKAMPPPGLEDVWGD